MSRLGAVGSETQRRDGGWTHEIPAGHGKVEHIKGIILHLPYTLPYSRTPKVARIHATSFRSKSLLLRGLAETCMITTIGSGLDDEKAPKSLALGVGQSQVLWAWGATGIR